MHRLQNQSVTSGVVESVWPNGGSTRRSRNSLFWEIEAGSPQEVVAPLAGGGRESCTTHHAFG